MKPMEELISLTQNEHAAARLLMCSPEFVVSWRDRKRELPNGKTMIEKGWEPSAGFIAAALAILRPHRQTVG